MNILATRTRHGRGVGCFAWKFQGWGFVGVEILKEGIRVVETLAPYMLSKRLRQGFQRDFTPGMRPCDPCRAANNFHGVADETVRSVMHAESHFEIRQ